MKTLQERASYLLELAGNSTKELAKIAGVRPASVSQWVNGPTKSLAIEPATKLAKRFELNAMWISKGTGPMRDLSDSSTTDSNVEAAGKPRTILPVKIKGFAKLGEDGFYEEVECDGWVDSYSPDPDAYGLRVKGDSMHPAIRNGSVVVIEPRGHLVPGEYVAIALSDGRKMVKELVFERAEEIVVESVNGNHRKTIERQHIDAIHPVAAVVSPSKWRSE